MFLCNTSIAYFSQSPLQPLSQLLWARAVMCSIQSTSEFFRLATELYFCHAWSKLCNVHQLSESNYFLLANILKNIKFINSLGLQFFFFFFFFFFYGSVFQDLHWFIFCFFANAATLFLPTIDSSGCFSRQLKLKMFGSSLAAHQ